MGSRYHIRVNGLLSADLKRILNLSDGWVLPQYFLVDSDGSVLLVDNSPEPLLII